MSKLKKRLVYGGLWDDRVVSVECPEKRITLSPTTKGEADRLIRDNHYSHKPTQNSYLHFAISQHGKLTGAIQIGYGIRPGKHKSGEYEFDRMWLCDSMPKFSESIVLSMLHMYLRAEHPEIKRLISYADESAGNRGTIYRAANYVQDGHVPCDFYLLVSGERVHPVSMYHRHGTRSWTALATRYPGIQHITERTHGYRQLRFYYDLAR